MLMLAMLYRRTYVQICLRCKKVNIIRGKFNKHIYFSMQENNDSAYTLNLNNVHLPETPKRNRKGQWNKGGVAWNRGKKWNEMFDAETIERLKKHLRELGKRSGNRGKGFEQLWRPVIQMDEYGNRLHWYQSSALMPLHSVRPVTNRPEGTFESLRYAFGGDHPSQTTHQTLSSLPES